MQGSLPEPGDIYQNAITDPAIPRVKDSQIGKRKHFQVLVQPPYTKDVGQWRLGIGMACMFLWR